MRASNAAVRTLLLSLALGLAACAHPAPAEPVAVHADATQLISARTGTTIELSMAANPSTGYVWKHSVLGKAESVELRAARVLRSSTGLLGSAGEERLSVVAREPGLAVIQSIYVRPGENAAPPARTLRWTITVGK